MAPARAYRELLRAQRRLFDQDVASRSAALLETRAKFREHADANAEQVPALLQ